VIEAVNGPVIDDKLIEYGANAWIDLAQLTAAIMTVTEAQIKDAWLQLVEYLDAWNYAAPCDRDIVAAMVMATDIQAVLPFRPHMWLSGPTNCGKTALMTLLKGLWPYAVEAGNETTEAGVRQSVARNCLPLLLDEQEAWPGRRRIINLLRSATRGDLVIKGRPGGDPLKFSMRVIGWMAAIDVGLRSAADRNRFLVVELEPSDRIAVPTEAVLGDLNVTLVAAAVVLAPKIIAMWERLRVAAAHRHYGRLLEAVAVPVAIKAAALGLSDEQADALLADMLDQKGAALTEQFEDDHEQLLVSILSARIRARGRPAVSRKGCHQQTVDGLFCVGDLIQSDVGWRELDTVGIRKLKHDRIFFAPNPVQRHLLGGRRWAETNIGSVLLRIPDARRDRQRVAGTSTRGVSLPMSALPMEETGEKDEVFTEIPAAPTEVLTETPANRTGSAIEDAAGDTGLVVEETTEAIDVISEGPKDVLDIPDDSESDEIAEELEPDMRRQALGASTPQLPHTVQEGR
jgi:hypothetical protein